MPFFFPSFFFSIVSACPKDIVLLRSDWYLPCWLGKLSSCLLKSISWVQFSYSQGTFPFFLHKKMIIIAENARAWVSNFRWKSTSSGDAEPYARSKWRHVPEGGKGATPMATSMYLHSVVLTTLIEHCRLQKACSTMLGTQHYFIALFGETFLWLVAPVNWRFTIVFVTDPRPPWLLIRLKLCVFVLKASFFGAV